MTLTVTIFAHVKVWCLVCFYPGGSNSTAVINPAIRQVRSSQPYSSATNRPSEEDERIKENTDVKVGVWY